MKAVTTIEIRCRNRAAALCAARDIIEGRDDDAVVRQAIRRENGNGHVQRDG